MMIWFTITFLCSAGCLIALGFTGVISEARRMMNLSRRLELGHRERVLRLVPSELRKRTQRASIIYIGSITLFFVLIAVITMLLGNSTDQTLAFQNTSIIVICSVGYFMCVPPWIRCYRRSNKLADLGRNPFLPTRIQALLISCGLFFVLLTTSFGYLINEHPLKNLLLIPFYLAFFILWTATRSEMAVYENGIFLGMRFYKWSEITWYRWYENRCGILFGHNGWDDPSPAHYVPAELIGSDKLRQILGENLPDKEHETVESHLEKTVDN